MKPCLRLRPAEPADHPFLLALFKAARPEFQLLPLPPEQLAFLYQQQFGAQHSSYRSAYPHALQSIVLADETPAGMLWVDRGEAAHNLLDIAILPEYRNRGIGSELLRELIAGAVAAAKPVRSSVAVENPASLRFHQKLGFHIVAEDEVYRRLEYSSGA